MGDGDIVPARVQNVLDMDVVRLNLWSIRFNGSGVTLEGFVRSEDGNMMQKVHSGIICRRMTATMLFDVSGCFYELAGHIDREFQLKIGMPSRVIDEFMNGFPDNWAFLIKSCSTSDPKSALRPIQAAPVEPLRTRGEPIVTMPDETVLAENQAAEKERRRKELQKKKEHEERLRDQRKQREAAEAVEKKRQEEEKIRLQEEEEERKRQEEEDAANYTFRAPKSQNGEAITPIRFTRGNGQRGASVRPIFEKTPVRTNQAGPLASSTPQAPPPQHPHRLPNIETSRPNPPVPPVPQPPIRETQYCSDSEFFAVPKLPAPKNIRSASTSAQPAPLGFLEEMDALFETANVDQTPGRVRNPRKVSRSPSPGRFNSSARHRDSLYDRFEPSRQSLSQRYYDDYDMSRMSGRNDTRRDESRNSRKRGYNNSPDEYRNRWDDRSRRHDNFESDSRYDSKRSRPRDQSSSSGRSVRFEEDQYRSRMDSRESMDSRNYRHYEDSRHRQSSGEREDKRKLNDILRREKELMARLQNSQRSSSTFQRNAYSSEDDEMSDEWDRENQEMLDNSMMFGDGISQKKRRSGGRQPAKQQSKPKRAPQPKPAPKPAQQKKKKKQDSDDERDEMNDSIASNRPRRACVTPSTPAPKRITWPKRDLDRLKHTIELKKPTGAEADWAEVTRLLAKDGVDAEVVKQIAITKLKWKEPTQDTIQIEEEEQKRRRGATARVKEGVRMHEELRLGGKNRGNSSQSGVEAVEDYEPDDVAADQSLLGLQTPIAIKKRGGTRASIMPQPVEDSPMVTGNNSTLNSPRLDQTKAKEVETTLKYVQHLSMMNARPSSRANTSYLNKSSSRDKTNTSLSVEQGARKALKIINRGRTIEEEDEDDEDGDTTID